MSKELIVFCGADSLFSLSTVLKPEVQEHTA
jgi:hypothetical protein